MDKRIVYAEPADYIPEDLRKKYKLGEYAESGHREVLETARKFFPEARLIVVGPDMKRAASALAIPPTAVFANSAEAAEHVKEFLKEGDLVFLKASRSTKMELIEG